MKTYVREQLRLAVEAIHAAMSSQVAMQRRSSLNRALDSLQRADDGLDSWPKSEEVKTDPDEEELSSNDKRRRRRRPPE